MARPLSPLTLTTEQQELLETITRCREIPYSLIQRVRIVLSASAGFNNKTISQDTGLCEDTVGLWRKRWLEGCTGLEKLAGKPKLLRGAISQLLADKPRPGSPGIFTAEQICRLLAVACETPPEHLSHWTRPELARTVVERGILEHISASSVGRFLKSGRFKTPPDQILAEPRSGG
jgi:transposase